MISTIAVFGQNRANDSLYTIELTTSIYPVLSFFNKERISGNTNKGSIGYGINIRGVWHPARRLAVGLMTGCNFLAKDTIPGETGASAQIVSVPIQGVMTMDFHHFEVGIGIGPYMMWSTINLGNRVDRTRFELGITFMASYYLPLNSNLYIGPELRISYMDFRGILSFMPSVNLHYTPLKY